jgi:hypothetical protein
MRHHLSHGVQLLETREDDGLLHFGAAVWLRKLLPVEVREASDDIQQNVT